MKSILVNTRVALVLFLGATLLTSEQVGTSGVAKNLLRSESRELEVEANSDGSVDKIFEDINNTIGPFRNELGEIFKKVQIQVVAPNKELAKMMTIMSTNTRSMLLEGSSDYAIHTATRPMLLSYLGLYFASDHQVADWYALYKARMQPKIIAACKSFIELREKAEKLDDNDLDILNKTCPEDNKLPFVYLKFGSNLNLFMLDNYLMLCSKLEPEHMKDKINGLRVKV